MNSLIQNKKLVQTFYQQIIAKRDTSNISTLIAENYIQHNPSLKTGRQGVVEAVEQLKQFPTPQNQSSPIKRMIADDSRVFVHLEVEFGPQKLAVADIFRIEDGILAEHWDCIHVQPEETISTNAMLGGESEVQNWGDTTSNGVIVKAFYEDCFIAYQKIGKQVSSDLIQHHPDVANTAEALQTYLRSNQDKLSIEKIHQIIAEGNFVAIQAGGLWQDQPHVFYDLFRLENGIIEEQWSLKQAIPDKMAHSNGML